MTVEQIQARIAVILAQRVLSEKQSILQEINFRIQLEELEGMLSKSAKTPNVELYQSKV